MSRFLAVVIAVCLMLANFTINVFAYDTSKISGSTSNSGATYPSYSQGCEQVNVLDYKADSSGNKDSSRAIQKALDYARDNASDSLQIKVYVPAGDYKISRTLRIYSNTWLYLEDGAVIKKGFASGCMLKNTKQYGGGGYDCDRNIYIEGGTWDGNTAEYNPAYFSNIRIGHARNVTFYNVEVANNKNGHHLELGGIEGLTIENCSFHGYTGNLQKEAIQLDVMNNSVLFVEYEPFDDTATNNVVIRNNKFYDLSRGLGSHSAVVGTYYTNTTIVDNTFEDISGECIIMYNHKYCTIKNNTMNNVGMAVNFMHMSDNGSSDYFRPVIGYDSAKGNINDDANTVISGNNITSNDYAIRIYGKNINGGSGVPDYDYCVQGVKISDNEITTKAQAIIMDDATDCIISNNIFSKDGDGDYNMIDIVRSRYITINSNKINSSNSNGVLIDGGHNFTIKSNVISNTGKSGICLEKDVEQSQISQNTVKKATVNGIYLNKNCNDITVSENIVDSPKKSGIAVNNCPDANIRCEGNTLSNIKKSGFLLTDYSSIILQNNAFSKTGRNIGVGEGSNVIIDTPMNFTATDITENGVNFSWDLQNEATGYQIFRKKGSMSEYELISDSLNTTFKEEKLASKSMYYYKVVPYFADDDAVFQGNAIEDFPVKTKFSVEKAYIQLAEEMAFTGRARTQNLHVVAQNTELIQDVDYKVEYSNNINVGTAQVKIIGIGDFCGETVCEFKILPKIGDDTVVPVHSSNSQISMNSYKQRGYNVKCEINDFVSLADGGGLKTPMQITLDSYTVKHTFKIKVRSYTIIDGTRLYGAWC